MWRWDGAGEIGRQSRVRTQKGVTKQDKWEAGLEMLHLHPSSARPFSDPPSGMEDGDRGRKDKDSLI